MPVWAERSDTVDITINISASAVPANIVDLAAAPGSVVGSINLTWTEPGDDGYAGSASSYTIRVSSIANIENDADFNSARPLSDFSAIAPIVPGPGGSLRAETVTGLTPGVTYYFAMRTTDDDLPVPNNGSWSRSLGANANNFARAHFTVALPPMQPLGVRVTRDAGTINLAWAQTTRYEDGTLFISTSAPQPYELTGYRITRSTSICDATAPFVQITTTSYNVTTATDTPGASAYYYRILSYNAYGVSRVGPTVTEMGDVHFFLDDCVSEAVMSPSQAGALSGLTNGYGADIMISARRRSQDTGGGVMQSAEFKPMLNGVTELDDFHLSTPVRIKLRYQTDGAGGVIPAASDPKNLGMYWHNGSEFKKLYGVVDTVGQTVTVQSPNLGAYQVRSLFRADGVVFDVSNVSAKVITPNDDGRNDVLIVTYDPGPRGVVPSGSIYDLRGSLVASMTAGLVPNTLVWDGRMNGVAVSGGVYVYQIKGDGKTFNGTIVVAK